MSQPPATIADRLAHILGVPTFIALGTAPETDSSPPTTYRFNLELKRLEFHDDEALTWRRSSHGDAIRKIFRGQRGTLLSAQGQWAYDALAAHGLLDQLAP